MSRAAPSVMFVCEHNADRSQMAQAWLTRLAGDRITAVSAGPAPGRRLNRSAVAVMTEVGIDISNQRPRVLSVDGMRDCDVVVTMGDEALCPALPGQQHQDWAVADPARWDVAAVRPMRDEIKTRVQALIAELLPPPSGGILDR